MTDGRTVAALIAIAVFAALVLAEQVWPRRRAVVSRAARWRTHLGFALINLPLERLVQAGALIGLYALVGGSSFGLFNWLDGPHWLEWTLAILALDFAVWAQHVATHKLPLFWRFHRVHHSDRDFDMGTALRFHPGEITVSLLYKMTVTVLLGVPLGALIVFELLLAIGPLFNHSNLRLPIAFDRVLRTIIVTPDMHRVHHSTLSAEHDSNYGSILSIWDRTFRTYTAQPSAGHDAMTIGLPEHQNEAPLRLGWSLKLPLQ